MNQETQQIRHNTLEVPSVNFLNSELPTIRDFKGANILSASQFERENLEMVFATADQMKILVEKTRGDETLKNFILATLFYEPSTRTRLSFESAIHRLGGKVISETSVQFSSIIKGEKLKDTIRVIEQYADVIALRHSQIGSAAKAADFAKVPIINAGDGAGEHPTQALLDLYTIKQKLGRIDGLSITMLGDLKFGRTVHSLATLLSHYQVKINFVSPHYLRIPEEMLSNLEQKGIEVEEANKLEELQEDFDILYVTRVQTERIEPGAIAANLQDSYQISPEFVQNSRALIMHPLPRVNEIPAEIDQSEKAIYFYQSGNGVYIRMALLKLVLLGA